MLHFIINYAPDIPTASVWWKSPIMVLPCVPEGLHSVTQPETGHNKSTDTTEMNMCYEAMSFLVFGNSAVKHFSSTQVMLPDKFPMLLDLGKVQGTPGPHSKSMESGQTSQRNCDFSRVLKDKLRLARCATRTEKELYHTRNGTLGAKQAKQETHQRARVTGSKEMRLKTQTQNSSHKP